MNTSSCISVLALALVGQYFIQLRLERTIQASIKYLVQQLNNIDQVHETTSAVRSLTGSQSSFHSRLTPLLAGMSRSTSGQWCSMEVAFS